MLRTSLRNVFAHKARLLMTVLAVMLGVAFVSGTLVFTNTVSDAYTRSSERSFDDLDVQIRSADGDRRRLLDQDLLGRAAALPGAVSASGVVFGFAVLADKDGEIVGDDWTTSGGNYDGTRHPLAAGRAPRAEGEIAIDAATAARTGFEVGDTVRLSVSGPVIREQVTGIFKTDDGNVAAGGTLTLFDTATAQKLFAESGRYTQIDLKAEPGTSPELLRRQAQTVLPRGVEAVTGSQLAREQSDRNAEAFNGLSQVLLACAGIALFVAVFLIVNTFTMLVAQRTNELALLRAVGASRGQVTRSVLAEAGIVGLVASAAGLTVGAGIAAAVRAVLSSTGSTLPDGPVVLSVGTVVISLALGIGVTVLAAWLPARHAAKVPPVAALSSVHAPPAARSLAVRNTVGAVFAAAGAAMVIAATNMSDGNLWMGIGAAVLLTGVFVLTPLLSRPAIAAARPMLHRFGICGALAGQNAVRNPRRTAATASALTIGLTLITGLTVVGSSANKATEALAAADYLRADYIVSMGNSGPLEPATETTLSELDEVTATSPARLAEARIDGTEQTITGVNADKMNALIRLDFIAGSFASPGDTGVVDKDTAAANGWQVGDSLPVSWPDDTRGELEITGIYESNFDDGVKVDKSVIDPHLERIADTEVLVKTADGPSEATERTLRRALGDSPAIRISDKQDLVDEVSSLISVVLALLYGMLALAVVVAVLGVVNTLAMSVHERSQEIGLLRAIGLDRSGVKLMVRLESLVISLFGGALGIGLGVFLGWAVGELVASMGIETWTLVLPWGRMALFFGVAALVGVVAALGPARRAAKLDLLTAIKAE